MTKFSEIVAELRHGATDTDLSQELQTVVDQCNRTGKVGTLTLTVKVVPKERDIVLIEVDSKAKAPKPTVESVLFYIGQDGRLTRRDPRQMRLSELKGFEVEDAHTAVRTDGRSKP